MLLFELLIAGALTTGGLGRILAPEICEKELAENPFLNRYTQNAIIIFELLAVYFIFFANKTVKSIYLWIYIIAVLFLSGYYIIRDNLLADLKDLCYFPSDIKAVFIHILLITIMFSIIPGARKYITT